MTLESLKSQENNQKGTFSSGKSTKIAAAFMQNKPNFKNTKIGASSFETSEYEILPAWRGKNQSQFKPNTNPIAKRPKMNTISIITMNYKDFAPSASKKTKPIQTQSNLSSNVAVGGPNTSLSTNVTVVALILPAPETTCSWRLYFERYSDIIFEL